MILTDFIIIACIGANMIAGYRRGFIWSFFGLASYFVAVICAKLFYLDVAVALRNHTSIDNRLEGFMKDNFFKFFQGNPEGTAEVGEGTFKGMGLIGEFLVKDIDIQTYAQQTVDVVKEEIAIGTANLLLNIISVILIFVIVKAGIILIGTMLDQLSQLPLLNGLNKTGGIIIGAVKGILAVAVAVMVMFVFATLSPNGFIASAIEDSLILQVFFRDLFPPLIDWLI